MKNKITFAVLIILLTGENTHTWSKELAEKRIYGTEHSPTGITIGRTGGVTGEQFYRNKPGYVEPQPEHHVVPQEQPITPKRTDMPMYDEMREATTERLYYAPPRHVIIERPLN
jgi:hypothetical protein